MIFFLLLLAAVTREEQTVEVNGVREVWRLEWKAPPKPTCEATPGWYTCPCSGFSFGESGALDLVRLRQGREVERLALKPLFEGDAIVQRWPTTEKDTEDVDAAVVARRPVVKIMNLADYDHDGKATEFYLQTSAGPCGHTQGVVIGVSAANPKLHAFGTALHPEKPLVLQKGAWEELLKARGPVQVVDWPCGDHGENKQIELRLQPSARGIDVMREDYACPRTDHARLLKRIPQ